LTSASTLKSTRHEALCTARFRENPCGIKSEHMEPGGLSNECRSIQSEALLRGRTARKNQSQEEDGWPHIASVVAAIQASAVAREVRADAYFITAGWDSLCWVAPPTGVIGNNADIRTLHKPSNHAGFSVFCFVTQTVLSRKLSRRLSREIHTGGGSPFPCVTFAASFSKHKKSR